MEKPTTTSALVKEAKYTSNDIALNTVHFRQFREMKKLRKLLNKEQNEKEECNVIREIMNKEQSITWKTHRGIVDPNVTNCLVDDDSVVNLNCF